MKNLFSDQNLDSVSFEKCGTSLKLEFINMYDGDKSYVVKCYGVRILNYQNNFEEDEGLACYVGEVTSETVFGKTYKDKIGFDLVFDGSSNENSEYILLRVLGGDVHITVLCEDFNLESSGS